MGYYDDFYEPERKKRRDQGVGRFIVTSVTSAVIGGLVVLLMMPALTKSGYVSLNQPNTALAMDKSVGATPVSVSQPVSLDVNTGIVQAVQKVENAVVGVINIQKVTNPWTRQSGTVESGEGSGVIFEKKGGKAHIITNYHVIDGAQKVEVSLPKGDRVEATILGADALTDLAVLEIDGSKVTTVAELGNSDTLKVGEPAIAIGNPLGLQFSQTVTAGIISSLNRSMPIDVDNDGQTDWDMDVLQTDAAINPGNSGGALCNIYGQVIGINSMKIAKEGVEGLGFAIPINDVKNIVSQLMQDGKLKRAYIGIQNPLDLTNVPRSAWKEDLNLPQDVKAGVVIRGVPDFSPAAKAGLKQYDVIVKLDDKEINSTADLRKYLTINKKPGDTVKVTFYRNGLEKTVQLTLGNSPTN
ncbi:S1C family serine protease [Brevibacillus massiliensis]|jgi:serine protease Do|uniref:S1C family serine protease n=1 Tax=Brevibacillus massiliensis TaxID=1118054 RepID=UPI0002F2F1DB|nr:trypsin-like peptidase domain-containing protein [Brevibacillus massiliensis]